VRVFRFLVLATATIAGALLVPSRAGAHAMFVDVKHAEDPVKVLAYFDEDMPAEFADVTVTGADGNVVLTGKTDEHGVWTFPRPTKSGTYTVTVKLTGHVAKREFTVDGEAETTAAPARRLNKWVGLGIGVAVLLGASGLSWLLRRRGRRLE
jgi:nickel transport protein